MADIVFPGLGAGGPIGQDYLPSNFDLVLYKGDYLPFSVTLKDNANAPIDLTGYTAQCSIMASYESLVSYDATCTIDALDGQVDIVFPSTVTSTMDAGNYIWDFQLTDASGNVRTYFTGDVKVYGEVTQ